ncbi:MAG: translation initiation factor IF-3 [Deltaproteobacteria bacterium]|nr:translation initiation factor IF-3 [Deltaproteobacteria bacterium]MBW1958907.1 translation initiation factor IF-3 [Deltaproteobacteria bacterium]MBW2012318.1 translation initiation factor IF-3 [Deltaproteobacteria bacterium]MBW2088311.1 translation initiation factor IF-3 [Deltaproteobacteria bacterium]MBW2320172.1 translation initiation factor IF-3 [Deltaproteobacteria bacterium]
MLEVLAIIYGSGGESIAIPRRTNRANRSSRININRNIRAKEVRVIDPDGNQIGIIPTYKAIAVANDFGLDLVEISPNANPPVCKIMDYGRYKYELTKKKQEAKKKQATFQLKEIKLRPKTGEHDLKTKISHIKKFIERKDKVKVTVIFRGREITLSQLGRDLLERVVQETEEIALVEQRPKFEGRTMIMVLSPKPSTK